MSGKTCNLPVDRPILLGETFHYDYPYPHVLSDPPYLQSPCTSLENVPFTLRCYIHLLCLFHVRSVESRVSNESVV